MRTVHPLRWWSNLLAVLGALPLHAQGSENAIAAAVLFGALAIGTVVAGLIITALYCFRRRPWQRVVVMVFGTLLLVGGSLLGAQPGAPQDIGFLSLLLSGAGVMFLGLGALVRPQAAASTQPEA